MCFAQVAQLILITTHGEDTKMIPIYQMRKLRHRGQHAAWHAAAGQWIITVSHADGAQTLGTYSSRDFGGNGGAAGDKDGKIKVEASSE